MDVLALLAPAFLAGLSVAASPGAVNLLCVQWGLQRGPGVVLGIGLGAATVDALYMTLALAGVLPLLDAAGWLEAVLMFTGGAVLVVLGIVSMRSGYRDEAPRREDEPDSILGRAPYAVGLSMTLLNPSTIAVWLAVSGGILASADLGSGGIPEGIGGGLSVAAVFTGSATWFSVFAVIVAVLRKRAREAHLRLVGLAAGALLAALGLLLLARGLAEIA